MMKKSIIAFLTMAFAMVGFSACSSDDNGGDDNGISKEFTVSRTDMQFTKNGGETELYVKSASEPTVSSNADWLSVSPESGTSKVTRKYIVKAEPNTANDDRAATITVAVGSESKTVSVSQNSTEGLIITSDKTFNISAEGGEFTVKLKANADYQQVISNDWVTENVSRANMVEHTHHYTVAANISGARTATISYTLKVDDKTSITEAVTVNQAAGSLPAAMEKSAMEISSLMYPGWNLGNTLEAGDNSNNWKNVGISTETSWQNDKTTQALIDEVKAQGFKSVRIPCSWVMGHITDAQNCTIDPAWLTRVHEIVDYCIKDGLYVIINDHWDGGWIEHNGLTADTDVKATKEKLTKIWTQIANSFKDYNEYLLFAGMNEPGVGGGDGTYLGTTELTARLAEYEQTFIDAVRATGGNNLYRTLIVQGPNTNIDKFVANNYVSKLKDKVTDRIMVEVHFYDPYQFTDMDQDQSWSKVCLYWGDNNKGGASSITSPANMNEANVEKMMKQMHDNFVAKGYPVLIGEYGAKQRKAIGTDKLHDNSVKDFYKAVVSSAINNGCVPMAWDNNGKNLPNMTIFDRKTAKVANQNMMEGIKAGVKAAHWPSK